MKTSEVFLFLTRLGIGHYSDEPSQIIDWEALKACATQQGLDAVVLDGIERLPLSSRPNQEFLLEWIGEVLQGYEFRYEQYRKAISELSGFYNSHGYKMMVLKGYVCSLDWPKPSHRPCGDVDIWLFGEFKQADVLLAKEKGIKVDTSEHHHTVFNWHDFLVENHYDFINVHDYFSSKELEAIFKKLGEDDSHHIEVHGEKVYVPSPDLHALFLLKHLVSHFTSTFVNIRQILDWAFFVEKHGKIVNWNWVLDLLEKYHMKDFYNCINAICVEKLGFESAIFPTVQFLPEMKEKILDDILNPKYIEEEPKWIFPRLIYKYRRWQSNTWKRDFCYNESALSGFITNVWAHILKPSSI